MLHTNINCLRQTFTCTFLPKESHKLRFIQTLKIHYYCMFHSHLLHCPTTLNWAPQSAIKRIFLLQKPIILITNITSISPKSHFTFWKINNNLANFYSCTRLLLLCPLIFYWCLGGGGVKCAVSTKQLRNRDLFNIKHFSIPLYSSPSVRNKFLICSDMSIIELLFKISLTDHLFD
jgi:hypothetical protein